MPSVVLSADCRYCREYEYCREVLVCASSAPIDLILRLIRSDRNNNCSFMAIKWTLYVMVNEWKRELLTSSLYCRGGGSKFRLVRQKRTESGKCLYACARILQLLIIAPATAGSVGPIPPPLYCLTHGFKTICSGHAT